MISVVKATGEKEDFSEEKIRKSVQRAGVSGDLQNQTLNYVKTNLYNNIPTSEIFNKITEFLTRSKYPYIPSRYGLKQAIMALGPTGYPFEDFVAQILKAYGFTTQTRVITSGKCINHEIDVIAQKSAMDGNKKIMIEAKFHNFPGTKTNIHVALYTKARFDDVKEVNNFDEVWLITNTKVTSDALSYALCSGMKIVSWNYPEGASLRDLIEKSNLLPITTLTTLSQEQKRKLLDQGIVMTKDICKDPRCLDLIYPSGSKKQETLSEAAFVSNPS